MIDVADKPVMNYPELSELDSLRIQVSNRIRTSVGKELAGRAGLMLDDIIGFEPVLLIPNDTLPAERNILLDLAVCCVGPEIEDTVDVVVARQVELTAGSQYSFKPLDDGPIETSEIWDIIYLFLDIESIR